MLAKLKRVIGKYVRASLRSNGFEVVHIIASNGPRLPLLDMAVSCYLQPNVPRSVIQIGANDGVMSDPINQLIRSHSLSALLVEPIPKYFATLQSNYAGMPNIHFENVAVGTEPGDAEIFFLDTSTGALPSWAEGIASFDKSVLLKHKHWDGVDSAVFERSIRTTRVKVETIRGLLARHNSLPDPVLLQIDTEGHDYEVIKSALEAQCVPNVVHYEHKHLSLSDQVACRELLAGVGYAFSSNDTDTLAVRWQV